MLKKALLIFALLLLSLKANSTILEVPQNYTTIQAAINAAQNGDTVIVAPGTYLENIHYRGKLIVVTSRYYQTGDLSIISSTIIDGSQPQYPDSASCVRITNPAGVGVADTGAVLQGFTITRGGGTKWADEHSPGSYREGGGILTAFSSPLIKDNIIKDNRITNTSGVVSTGGGGIRAGDGNPRIYNNIITGNSGLYGAGVVLNYCGVTFRNNLVYKNFGSQSYGTGSGMWINNNNVQPKIIENNTIISNTANAGTGGVLLLSSAITFRNNILWANTGTQFLFQGGASVQLFYNDIQGEYNGVGNINIEPLFDTTNYYLKAGSPCIDKGDSSAVYNDIADPQNPGQAKFPSRGTIRNDIGAYGGPYSHIISNTLVGVRNNPEIIPQDFSLRKNYPNPFNPSTTIEYSIPSAGFVKVSVYDMTGRLVSDLFSGEQNTGSYKINFNAGTLASGVYEYKVEYNNSVKVGKMVLVK